MKANRFHEYGGPEVMRYEDAPDPVPDAGEVVIRVRACALNHLDLDLRDGTSRIPLQLPFISGLEIAGEIVELGSGVTDYRVGERVMPTFYYSCGECDYCRRKRENLCPQRSMFGVFRPGGYAELVTAPARTLMRIPDNVSFDAAAATQLAFGTAFHMLHTRAQVRQGESILIQAAGSGIGSAAIQIAARSGLKIIATAGSDDKLRKAEALGAQYTINYKREKMLDAVMDYTDGKGVDVVFEHVGGEVFTDSIHALAMWGRLVTCGAHAGEAPKIDVIELFRKEASVIGSYTCSLFELAQVLALVELGKLKPVIHQTLPLAEAGQAQQIIAKREQFGKVVLNP